MGPVLFFAHLAVVAIAGAARSYRFRLALLERPMGAITTILPICVAIAGAARSYRFRLALLERPPVKRDRDMGAITTMVQQLPC